MFGTSSAQNAHILCLDFCTAAATHQDIRPMLQILLPVIQLLHALSFLWRIIFVLGRSAEARREKHF